MFSTVQCEDYDPWNKGDLIFAALAVGLRGKYLIPLSLSSITAFSSVTGGDELHVCVPPSKIHILKPYPSSDGMWKWGFWEVIRLR